MARPNILWICTDQQRTDSLGCYGQPHVATPHLDALAAQGALFEHAYAQSPVCTPSRASFLTGRYPRTTRCRQNGQTLPPDEVLVTRLFQDAGYATGLSGKLHLSGVHPSGGRSSEHRGDDGYDAFHWSHHPDPDWAGNAYIHWLRERGATYGRTELPACRWVSAGMPAQLHQTTWCVETALQFMASATELDRPWLFSINFFDPHHPFDPPATHLERKLEILRELEPPNYVPGELKNKPRVQRLDSAGAYNQEGHYPFAQMGPDDHLYVRAAYLAMVELIDEQVGRLLEGLEALGARQDTVVVFMSDHGEMLGDHGIYLKGPYFYDPLVRVPLVMSWPGRFVAQRTAALTELVDLAPTLLEAAGLDVPTGMQGRSLMALLTGATTEHRPDIYCEYYNAMPWHRDPTAQATMVRTERHKLALQHGTGEGELYDLLADPAETHNLWSRPDCTALRADLLQRLADRMAWTVDPLPPRQTDW